MTVTIGYPPSNLASASNATAPFAPIGSNAFPPGLPAGSGGGGGGAATAIPFSTEIPLDGNKVMARTVVAGAVALTVGTKVAGGQCRIPFATNGVNVPTIVGASEWANSFGYDNSQAGLQNVLDVWTDDGINIDYAWTQPLINVPVDVTAPTAGSATVENATPAVINLIVNEAVDTAAPPAAASLTVNAGHAIVSTAWGTSTRLDITVTPAFVNAEAARTLAYSPGANPIRDIAGNLMLAFSGKSITNNVGSALEAEVTAWLARVATASGTVSAPTQTAVNNFVVAAKAAGYFSKLRRINLFCGNAAASLVPLVNASGGTVDVETGTTYAESTGRVGGGAAFIDTGYTPTQATGGLSAYLRTAVTADTTGRILMGTRDGSNLQVFRMMANSNGEGVATAGAVNGSWGGIFTAGTPQANTTGGMTAGLWQVTRQGATDSKLYKNGALANTMATSITPATPGFPLFLFCNNSAGTAAAFLAASSAIGAYAVDSGMTGTEAGNFYTHLQAFQTALSRNV